MIVMLEEIRNILEKVDTMVDMGTLKNDIPLIVQEVNSLDMVNIYLLPVEHFNVKIPDNALGKLNSIDAIVSYLSKSRYL